LSLLSVGRQALRHFIFFQMIYVYAIRSLNKDYIYVGMTNDIDRRFRQHNKGYNKITQPYLPYKLIYSRSFSDRRQARQHEKAMKSSTGKRMLYKISDE